LGSKTPLGQALTSIRSSAGIGFVGTGSICIPVRDPVVIVGASTVISALHVLEFPEVSVTVNITLLTPMSVQSNVVCAKLTVTLLHKSPVPVYKASISA